MRRWDWNSYQFAFGHTARRIVERSRRRFPLLLLSFVRRTLGILVMRPNLPTVYLSSPPSFVGVPRFSRGQVRSAGNPRTGRTNT